MFADTEEWMLSSCLARFWKSENLFQVAHYRDNTSNKCFDGFMESLCAESARAFGNQALITLRERDCKLLLWKAIKAIKYKQTHCN